MNPMHRLLLLAAIALAASPAAAQGEEPAPEPPSTPLQQWNGVKYLNGGASEEDRVRMRAQSEDYPVGIMLSGRGGEFIVAQTLTLTSRSGATIASVPDAGPFVMFNLPPGRYTAELTLADGAHAKRSFEVGNEPQTLNWNLPQAPR